MVEIETIRIVSNIALLIGVGSLYAACIVQGKITQLNEARESQLESLLSEIPLRNQSILKSYENIRYS